jgi:hypothetical protein
METQWRKTGERSAFRARQPVCSREPPIGIGLACSMRPGNAGARPNTSEAARLLRIPNKHSKAATITLLPWRLLQ